MSERKWTPEQEQAISFRGGAVIVSAAAGSGKTSVLIERIMRLLTDKNDPVDADKLVVSTFTNEAAAQIKQRLDTALSSALAKDPDDERLEDQLLKLSDASISTISSFCLSILKNNSALLGLSPGLSVLEASEAKLIFSEAVTSVLEDLCKNVPDDRKDILYDWFGGDDDKAIAETLEKMYEFSAGLVEPKEFFLKQLGVYENPADYFAGRFDKDISDERGRLRLELSELSAKFTDDEKDRPFRDFLTACENNLAFTDNPPEAGKAPEKLEFPRLPTRKGFDNSGLRELREGINKLYRNAADISSDISSETAKMKACAPVLKILIELLGELTEKYTLLKREKGRIDFADMERLALGLLRGENGEPSAVAKELSENIEEIIVDEFQDSNEVQYEIFRLLSKNKKNLCFVGDIKQSIYRFRGADPFVFSKLCEDKDFTVIKLNKNFRSNSNVIEFVNALFTGSMTKENGGVEYSDGHQLVQGAEYETGGENDPELITFKCGDIEISREAEAAYIADRIAQMVAEGFPVTDKGQKRPCCYSDFAVIMGRYSRPIPIYKNALERVGIPYIAKEDGDYTNLSEIRLMLSLLKVIDDPYRDTDLAAVMMSPPYLFTADDMARFKLKKGKKTKHKNLWTGLRENAENDPKASAFIREIEQYREFSGENSVQSLVRKIYDESLMIPAIAASPNGERREMNIRMLIVLAGKFSDAECATLYDFIKYIESFSRQDIKVSSVGVGGVGSDAVKLMTIHGSKGLEFPICFVSNVSLADKAEKKSTVILERSTGIGIKHIDTKLLLKTRPEIYDRVGGETDRLANSEQVRLLYVAATRAKEKLIFTVPTGRKSTEKGHYGLIKNSGAMTLLSEQVINSYTPLSRLSDESAALCAEPIPDFFRYAHEFFTKEHAKVTATQIGVKSSTDFAETTTGFDRYLRVPSFLRGEEKKLSGKKRGDAYHKAMELLDFSSGESALSQLDGLYTRGKLTELERLSIDEKQIQDFLDSDVCARAAKSGEVYREYPIFCEYIPEEKGSETKSWEGEEKPFIQGIVDMFFIEDGRIVLVDYKTNRNVTPEQLTDEYRGQLAVYADALSKSFGLGVKQKVLYSFSLGEVEVV